MRTLEVPAGTSTRKSRFLIFFRGALYKEVMRSKIMRVIKLVLISLVVGSAVFISACSNTNQNSVAVNTTVVTENTNNLTTEASTIQEETSTQVETTIVKETEKVVEETMNKEQVEMTNETTNETESIGVNNMETNNILVAYFSATGTTKRVAEKIAELTNAELYEIVPLNPYSDADLNWNDNNSRSTKEMDDKNVRPEIGSSDIDLTNYTTIYLGYPIWWGDAPRIMSTFVEKYNFDGKKVIPFCTSGGSGIGHSGSNLASLAKTGNWANGERLNSSADTNSIQNFINSNN